MNTILPIAVVPVFVNVGAALLPALIAGVASVAALLLKPRELVRLFRSKPYISLGLAGVFLAGWLVWRWVGTAPVAVSARVVTVGTDWVQVALERIRQEERAVVPGQTGSVAKPTGGAAPVAVGALYYRGGPARTGHLGGVAPAGLAPLWEYTQDNTMFCASPLAVGDAVYGASVMLDAGTSYGSVFRLDVMTGKSVWTADFKDAARTQDFKGFFSSPAISADGASVIIGQGLHQDANSELVCLDAATGRVRWLVSTPLHIEGSPAIEGDIAVAGAGAVEQGDDHRPRGDPEKEGNPGFVMGVRISDGKLLWRHPVIDPESSPAIAGGVAYIGSGVNGNAVVALRIAPDEELKAAGQARQVWKTATPYPATGAVTVYEDLVLVGCGKGDFVMAVPDPEGVVLALDRQTGAERWRVAIPDAVLGAIAARDGKAIVPVRNGEVLALDLQAKGAILWRARVDGTSPILAAPAFAGPYVYAVSQNGYLAVFRVADGGLVERTYINSKNKPGEMGLSTSAPLVVNGRLYVGSETGGLRCFE